MKVSAILGSPKKNGNSSLLAQTFLEESEKRGAITESFFLQDMEYGGCIACEACKAGSDKCVLNDDLTRVLDAMYEADIILFASPNYFSEVTGQFKLFLDRTYSFLTPEFLSGPNKSRLPDGKKVVFIFTQGAPDTAFTEIPEKYSRIMGYFGLDEFHSIHGCNLFKSGEVKDRPDLLQTARELAAKLTALTGPAVEDESA
ncbi:MAG: flavodoxin family protein [Candidatus Rifleibacteriota bacterium]